MSPLRDNLDRVKAEYKEIRYGGDLARDVLGAITTRAPAESTISPWPRRAMAIAAAIALSATTFFAGRYLERQSSTEIASEPTNSMPVIAERPAAPIHPQATDQSSIAADNGTQQAEDFTLVPSLASAATTATDAAQAASAAEQSMDFSLSVPSAPMLFSLASLAEQETQQTTIDGETEERS